MPRVDRGVNAKGLTPDNTTGEHTYAVFKLASVRAREHIALLSPLRYPRHHYATCP